MIDLAFRPVPKESFEGERPGLTNAQYHALPELSSSDIKQMWHSPKHFKRLVLEKHLVEKESTDAFDLGTAVHSAWLEKDFKGFIEMPDFKPDKANKLTKKAQVEEFQEKHKDLIILSKSDYRKAMKMVESLEKSPLACQLLKGADVESSFVYKDEETGLWCKFRPDILRVQDRKIVDLKTSATPAPYEFAKAIARFGYHISAAHYEVGFERVFEVALEEYIFIVQGKTEPYPVGIYELTKKDRDLAIAMRRKIMAKIAEALDKDFFPDWSHKVHEIHVPGYAYEFN